MLVLPGLTYLLVFVAYVNPIDIWAGLKDYPFVHLGLALTMLGFGLDVAAKITKINWAPHFLLATVFVGWCLITVVVKAPSSLSSSGTMIVQSYVIYFMIAHGVTTFRAFRFIVMVVMIMDMAAALVAVTQFFGPYQCTAGGKHINLIDGRACDPDDKVEGLYGVGLEPRACVEGFGAIKDVEYECEKTGIWGMNTNHGRATAFGWLTDSNDVALYTGVGLPFAFAYRERKKTVPRTILWAIIVVMFGIAAVASKSRGGQIVYAIVLMVYFINRYGLKGLIVAGLGAAPLVLLGGRSSTEASNSANHRIELWYAGTKMLAGDPIFGVGFKQFMRHSADACHNAYANAFSETGLPGYFLYLSIVYISIKIPWEAYKHVRHIPGAHVAKVYSLATLAALIGLHVDLMFLSHTYNFAVWTHYGLTGALYTSIKQRSPEFKVKYSWREFGIMVLIGMLFIALIVLVNTISPPEIKINKSGE